MLFRSGVGSRVGAAARGVASGIAGTVGSAFTNPRAFRQAGITGTIAGLVKRVRDSYKNVRDQQLKAYFLQLDLPAGPPKQGSRFTITATDGTYKGVVSSVAPIAGRDTLTIDAAKTGASAATGAARRYEVQLDKNNRPYFWPQAVMVSDLQTAAFTASARTTPGAGYVKNERESNNNYTLRYDTATQSFLLGPNKTYACLMLQGSNPPNLGQGTLVKGIDLATGLPIEGLIVGPLRDVTDPNTKANVKVYPVEANFK